MTPIQIIIDRLCMYAARALAVTLGVVASALPASGTPVESATLVDQGDDFITIR